MQITMQSFLFIFSKLKPVPKLVPIYSANLELSKGSWKKKEPSKSKCTVISLSTSCQSTSRRFEQNSMNTCSKHWTQHTPTQAKHNRCDSRPQLAHIYSIWNSIHVRIFKFEASNYQICSQLKTARIWPCVSSIGGKFQYMSKNIECYILIVG